MSGGSRSLPVRPSLRFLKLEAKRRLAAGEFATLHDAQAAIAREHGLPGWAGLKQGMNSMYQPYPGSERQLPEAQRPPAPPFALSTVDTTGGLAATVKIWWAVVWLVALAAVVFLWRRSSTAYFTATPS